MVTTYCPTDDLMIYRFKKSMSSAEKADSDDDDNDMELPLTPHTQALDSLKV